MNEELQVIEHLESEIQSDKQSLLIKQAMLQQAKSRLKQKKVFGQGKLSKGYLKAMRAFSKPFASLSAKAEACLDHPVDFQAEQLVCDASKVISSANELTGPHCKNANKVCKKAAKYVMKLEDFVQTHEDHLDPVNEELLRGTVDTLREVVEKLRPQGCECQQKARELVKETITTLEINNDRNSDELSSDHDSGQHDDLREAPKEGQEVHSQAQPAD